MIVWLASYPKSGNTWIRIFLSTLLYSNKKTKVDINKEHLKQFPLKKHFKGLVDNFLELDEIAKNSIAAQEIINLEDGIKFYKTHSANWKNFEKNYYFTNSANSLGAIHIVRDPRNIISSILDYYNKNNYEDAFNFLVDRGKVIGGTKYDNGIPTILLSWADHYNSWKVFKKNYYLIKYENLISNPHEEFLKFTDYLTLIGGYKFDKKQILEVVDNCHFEKFSKQEENDGYIDQTIKNRDLKKKFFNLGPKNDWKKTLNSEITSKIERQFEKEMQEIGYL
tara:strand:+ start:290 stop:1129 length:840 start_codon:yes stop_codon:yes gene_type:complete